MSLVGKTVVLTRSPDRASAMLKALAERGARGWLLPLIDFEAPSDPEPMNAAMKALQQGMFDWFVITSVTTVRALGSRAAALGVELQNLVPPRTRVAAVGTAAAGALEAAGIGVDLLPSGEQSAQGLLESLTRELRSSGQGQAVFLPQADIAGPTLREGLDALGARAVVLDAYCTVDFPAAVPRRLLAPAAEDPALTILSSADFRRRKRANEVDALVVTSPSTARRVRAENDQLATSVRIAAIGRPTAQEAAAVGLRVDAVAAEPTPAGIIAALEDLFPEHDTAAHHIHPRPGHRRAQQLTDAIEENP